MNTQTLYQTEMQPVTQTVLSTISLSPTTSILTTTETSVSMSRTTVAVPTTVNSATTVEQTVYQTTTSTVTTTAGAGTAAVILLPSGSLIEFASGQKFAVVPQASIALGFDGLFVISWQTTNSTNVHWTLVGNEINETSVSSQSSGAEFPVQANTAYSLFVYDDSCTQFTCNTAFNVTAMIYYTY